MNMGINYNIMEELTIEQKAQRYDEALKVAKDMTGYSSPCVICAACCKGFDVEGWKNINKIM